MLARDQLAYAASDEDGQDGERDQDQELQLFMHACSHSDKKVKRVLTPVAPRTMCSVILRFFPPALALSARL